MTTADRPQVAYAVWLGGGNGFSSSYLEISCDCRRWEAGCRLKWSDEIKDTEGRVDDNSGTGVEHV